jgi:hypothetical protein
VQTTLLGLAIAVIVAIIAALVAPLVVDWNHYRGAFEIEVGRLTGLSVRVGSIDARILPTPIIKLRDVAIGEGGGAPQLRAAALELEVRFGPLLRGDVQATQARLVAPQFSLTLDRSGALALPALARSFRPEELSVSRLTVEDGSVDLSDAASGAQVALRKLSFDGDVRSLVGPFKGDGAFTVNDEPFAYRISGGVTDDGVAFKVRLGVDPQDRPLTTNLDGALTVVGGVPRFAGAFTLDRPAAVALANGERVMGDPWRATVAVQATPAAAELNDIAFQYGPEERAINVSGKADVSFGAHPHFTAAIKALDVDVDRALAAPDLTHRPPLLMVKSFAETFVAAARLPMPGDVSIAVEGLTVGGASVQSLRGTVRFDDSGWSLDGFELRAPGLTAVNVSGRIDQTPQGLAFSGPATLESADADRLMAWLGGRKAAPTGQTGTLRAQGNITVAGDRLAVDRLTASLDQETVEGRASYTWPVAAQPAVVDADLRASKLDLDALGSFAAAASDASGFALPRAGALKLDIGKATLAGVDAQAIKIRIKFDAGALQIERLSVGALGGAALEASGRIDELSSQPSGRVTMDLDARSLGGLIDIAGKFAPRTADLLRRAADRLAPAKAHAVVTVERAGAAGSATQLDVSGQLGLLRLTLTGKADGDASKPTAAQVHIDSRLDADDGTMLTALFGVDRVFGVDQLPGRLTLTANGPLNGNLDIGGELAASGLDATVQGSLHGSLQGSLNDSTEAAPAATLLVAAKAADVRPLQQLMTGQPAEPVPVSAKASAAVSGAGFSLTHLDVAIGKTTVRGRLDVALTSPVGIAGDIRADTVDGAAVAALLLGLPRPAPGAGAIWSNAPLGTGAFTAARGVITFTLDRASFTPALIASDLKGTARFAPSELALADLDGAVAGGKLSGALSFRRNVDGVVSHGHIELADADAASVLQADKRFVDARLSLKLDGDSIGASPAAIVSALHGGGTIALADAHLAGFDPAAFAAAMRAADQFNAVDAAKILPAVNVALINGRLDVPQGEAPATIAGGKLSVANVMLHGQDGSALALAGTLDLTTGAVDARMTLSGQPPQRALIAIRPELSLAFKGPLAAPSRTLDVSALSGWLAMRAAELQTRRLESLETNTRNDVLGRANRPQFPVLRPQPNGLGVESGLQLSKPAQTAQRLDLLRPILPAAADASTGGQIKPHAVPLPPAAPRPPDKRAPLDLLRPQN